MLWLIRKLCKNDLLIASKRNLSLLHRNLISDIILFKTDNRRPIPTICSQIMYILMTCGTIALFGSFVPDSILCFIFSVLGNSKTKMGHSHNPLLLHTNLQFGNSKFTTYDWV